MSIRHSKTGDRRTMNRSTTKSAWFEASLWGLATFATRAPFGSQLPYHWDSVQFVMGMSHFDVQVHQPHPPGYLFYVWMGRALLPLAGDPHRALVWLSLLFAGLGAAVQFRLGEELLGRRPARVATALYLVGPLFWFFGEVALTYVVDFTLVGLVALFAYRLYRGDGSWGTVLGMSLSLGIAGGVRATTLPFLAPLCLLASMPVARSVPRRLAAGAGLVLLLTLAWLLPTAAASGGWSGYRTALAAQREFVNQTAVWTVGWTAIASGLTTHTGCLINALGAAVLPLCLGLYLRWRRPAAVAAPAPGLGLFLSVWLLPSAVFYLLVHFATAGYAMSYLGAVLLASAWTLERLWELLGGRGTAAVVAGVTVLNAWVFVGGTPLQQDQTGFGVLTRVELRNHDAYWDGFARFVRSRYAPGKVALLVTPSFTDGLRMAQYLLPEYWPTTALLVDPALFSKTPECLKPDYFRYVTPDEALREGRPTLCAARAPVQAYYLRRLFGDEYGEVTLAGGMRAGKVGPSLRPPLRSADLHRHAREWRTPARRM